MKRIIAMVGCLFLFQPLAVAEVSDEEIRALREQIRQLSERLDQLEQAARDDPSPSSTAAPTTAAEVADPALDRRIDETVDRKVEERMAAVAWAERMQWSGDFRYRYEHIEQDGREDRSRNRIRARAGLQARVSDTMRVGLGLASGSDDPVSTNQTLGGGGSHKPLNIDMAYFEWTGLTGTAVTGGKYKNPLRQVGGNALVWDSDWRPEGFALRYDGGTWFATGIGTWVESDSATSSTEFSYAAQAGFNLAMGNRLSLMAGAGYADIGSSGKRSFFGDDDFFGNSFDPATGTYLFDYRLVEGFAELSFEGLGRPVALFADYVTNLDAADDDSGYSFGFQFGEARARGDWEFVYTYKRLEADAVLGLLADSDFGGGGTDARGSVLQGAYAFHDNWAFELTYLINETGLRSGSLEDYNRLQVDLNFKYK